MKGKPRVSSLGATIPPICATQNAGPDHGKERRELGVFFLKKKKKYITDRVGGHLGSRSSGSKMNESWQYQRSHVADADHAFFFF
jgi:hypothetical protein